MKIMFIIHSLDKVGGAETVLTRLANYFSSQTKHKIILNTLTTKNIIFELDKNIKIEKNKNNENKHSYLKFYTQIKNIKASIEDNQPDIIISFVTGINILATIAAKLSHTPIIISERSSYEYGSKNKLWSLLRRYIYPLANTLVLPSRAEENKYHYSKQIEIIPNPLKSLTHEINMMNKEKIILAVGTLHFVKGFDMLIEAFSKVNMPNWKLIILGEGSSRKDLEKQISELNLKDSIIMPGHTKDVESYYRKASIFVLSSRSEGYPNVLCEAMSYGCAPIAFNCLTGPSEIIDNHKNGLLIEAENVLELSKAIKLLIQKKELRSKISHDAQQISIKLHLNTIATLWEKSINNVMKG